MGIRIAGKLPSGDYLRKLEQSPQYKNGAFQNITHTPMMADDASYWKMLRNFFKRGEGQTPSKPIPSVKTDLNSLGDNDSFTWFGHSSYLLHIAGKNFLVDPVLSGNASPVSFMVSAFPGADIYKAEDMPTVDYLVLTHDHYDHLDYKTLMKLKSRIGKIYCSLGVGSHLIYWGFDQSKIFELDWWQQASVNETTTITAAPARHFSGRGVKRGQALWSSFILNTESLRIFIGGDSGYEKHFSEIGNKYGPFDIAILECGQYNKMWPFIHMMPEETVQASIDLRAKVLIPVHWGKFQLAMHVWDEPITRVMLAAKQAGVELHTAKIGETMPLVGPYTVTEWWK